jgi:hypothetical protein
VEWTDVAQDRYQWWDLVKKVLKLGVPLKVGNLFMS